MAHFNPFHLDLSINPEADLQIVIHEAGIKEFVDIQVALPVVSSTGLCGSKASLGAKYEMKSGIKMFKRLAQVSFPKQSQLNFASLHDL